VQAVGPWTLAASIELAGGHRVLRDRGATRDLAASLAEGLRQHLDELRRRLPGAVPVLQLDEPSLPAVIAGHLPTPSGYGTVRAIEATAAEQTLRDVLLVAPSGSRVIHCCAADIPLGVLRNAGADAISLDMMQLDTTHYDALGEAVEAGVSLWLGVLPATDAPVSFDVARAEIRGLWSTLGFPLKQLGEAVVATPSCGMSGASPEHVRAVFRTLRDLGSWLQDAEAETP
jgi:methionine synthase II (cobalamin-independent)